MKKMKIPFQLSANGAGVRESPAASPQTPDTRCLMCSLILPLALICAGGLLGALCMVAWRLLVASQGRSLWQVFLAYSTLVTTSSTALGLGWIAFRAMRPRTVEGSVTSVFVTKPSVLEVHPTLVVHLERERILLPACLLQAQMLPVGSSVRVKVAPFGLVTAFTPLRDRSQ